MAAAPVNIKLVKLAWPLAFVARVVVPESATPVVGDTVTTTLVLGTGLPAASVTVTAGWVVKAPPLVAPAGAVLTVTVAGAP